MVQIFVGSSSEAKNRGALEAVCDSIKAAMGDVDVRPWTQIFTQGEFTLQALIEEARRVDFAVLIFAEDDKLFSRGKRQSITRANVLFESGMFLGKLGPRRVAHIVEGKVSVPTDLSGLVTIPVESLNSADLEKAKERIKIDIARAWGDHRDLSQYGLDRTLRSITDHGEGLRDRLVLGPKHDRSEDPVIIDAQACQDAYEEGLTNVNQRFWTTTYLTSGFWTTNAAEALKANQILLKRLSSEPSRSIQRLFLLPKARHEFIQSERVRITHLRDREEDDEVLRQIEEIKTHERNISQLNFDGCDTRCVHDLFGSAWRRLDSVIQKRYRAGDTEVAIYDDFRIDLFSGGATGAVDRVICFLEETSKFDKVIYAGLRYFEDLWNVGEDALTVVKDWRQAVERAADSLSYPPDWQWIYDHDLPRDDEKIKEAEMKATQTSLIESGPHNINRYLDIGTCTGRYPVSLKKAGLFSDEVKIVALDADRHCCRTTRKSLNDAGISNFEVPCEDFLIWARDRIEEFDLITCMLGTISHFGAPVSDEPHGKIDDSIQMMADLMAPNGILILGVWSRGAISSSNFLSIYNQRAQQKLIQWSPSKQEITDAIIKFGLEGSVVEVENKIYVWTLKKKKTI